jgi:hypothetical protein
MRKPEGTCAVENVGEIGDPVAQLRMGVAGVFSVHATRGFGFWARHFRSLWEGCGGPTMTLQ